MRLTDFCSHKSKQREGKTQMAFASHIVNVCDSFPYREEFSGTSSSLKNMPYSNSIRKMRLGL